MMKIFRFICFVFALALLLLVLPGRSVAQVKTKITYGNLDGRSISVEEFLEQKQLSVPDGIVIDSALVYFSIVGKPLLFKVRYLPAFDSTAFYSCANLLTPGSTVMFTIFVTDVITGPKKYEEALGYVISSVQRQSGVAASPVFPEWQKLREAKYISGTIYFSGGYFREVTTFSIQYGSADKLRSLFERCTVETRITFDNVVYKDDKGNMLTRNDSFTF